jgi:phage shock protein PspC (stress-responsive transcriptional regulator)
VSASATVTAPTRPSGWPTRSKTRVAFTGTIGGLAERLGAPANFLRALLILTAYAEAWVFAAYVVTALALAAPGQRRPGLDSVVVAGRMAALIGLCYATTALPGMTMLFDLEGEPSSWIPFSAIGVAGAAALLVRRRPDSSTRMTSDVVLGAAPFVLVAVSLALAVVLLPGVRWERWLFVPTVIAGLMLLAQPRSALVRAAIPPAIVFASASALVIGTGVRLEGGVGDTTLRPRTAAEVPREVRRGVGDVELDLTSLRQGPRQLTVDASVGLGTLDVTVPPRTAVEIDVRVGEGRLFADNVSRDEQDGRVIGRVVPVDDKGRAVRPRMRLRLRLHVGVGEVSVNSGNDLTRWTL